MAVDLILEHSWLRGILLGLAIAAPVGPIGILCIRRTLSQGWQVGLLTGLGAATADGIYGCIAGLGLSAFTSFLVAQQAILKVLGGLFLIYLGLRTLQKLKAPDFSLPTATPARTLWLAYSSSLGLTLTNPATILSFVAILTGVGRVDVTGVQAFYMIAGIFFGSTLWWLFLSGVTHRLRQKLPRRFLQGINWVSGIVLLGFGVWAIASLWS